MLHLTGKKHQFSTVSQQSVTVMLHLTTDKNKVDFFYMNNIYAGLIVFKCKLTVLFPFHKLAYSLKQVNSNAASLVCAGFVKKRSASSTTLASGRNTWGDWKP